MNHVPICNYDEVPAKAKVLFRAGIDGEKKYSPPFGTTHLGKVNVLSGLLGLVPESESSSPVGA